MEQFEITFDHHPPVKLTAGDHLCEHLSVANSPVLFGCRTGICGTCVVEVSAVKNGTLPPPSEDELEVLALTSHGARPNIRLACQLSMSANLHIKPCEG